MAESNHTSLKVSIPDFHDGHDAEQLLNIFELIMARNREGIINQYLNESNPVPANLEALNAAPKSTHNWEM